MNQNTTQRDQFQRDGYVIVRDVIPTPRLSAIRDAVEELIARYRASDPEWDTCPIPRVNLAQQVDALTVEAIEIAFHHNTLEISSRLLGCHLDAMALKQTAVLCNPEFEPLDVPPPGQELGTDPRNWHRDIRPDNDGPLSALIADGEANGAGYVQWNIALYDDAIFHFVPGSQRRLNLEVESTQLQLKSRRQSPLPDCICADLQAGDGVVYNNMLLHRGSKYTNRQLRRTIQLSYRSFGYIFPNQYHCRLPERICDLFPVDASQQSMLQNWFALYRNESTIVEGIFRAILERDERQFSAGICRLHPGKKGRLTCIILLSIVARNLAHLVEAQEDHKITNEKNEPLSDVLQRQIATNFTVSQVRKIWDCFQPIDSMLRTNKVEHRSGFLGIPTEYAFEIFSESLTEEGVTATIFAS